MPTFDRAEALKMILPSLRGQTFRDWKLVLLDDGSVDDTEGVVFRLKEPRIEYHRQENVGVTIARNRLLDLADTEYACWWDSDDKGNQYRLELLVRAMDEYGPPHVRTGQTFWKGDNDKSWMLPPTLLWHGGVCVASVMFRPKEAVRFNEEIQCGGEDMEWECRMQERNGRPLYIPLALYSIGMRRGANRLSKLHKSEATRPAAEASKALANKLILETAQRMEKAGIKKGQDKIPWPFIEKFLGGLY